MNNQNENLNNNEVNGINKNSQTNNSTQFIIQPNLSALTQQSDTNLQSEQINNTNNSQSINSSFINSQPIPNDMNANQQLSNTNQMMPQSEITPNPNTQNQSQNEQPMSHMSSPNNTNQKKNNQPIIIGGIVAIIVIVALVILFAGNKTLVCTMNESAYGMKMTAEANINFRLNKANNANMRITFDLGNYASQKDIFLEKVKEEYQDLEEEGVDIEITSDDSKIYVDFKVKRENFNLAGLAASETYQNTKEELEEDGFTCK